MLFCFIMEQRENLIIILKKTFYAQFAYAIILYMQCIAIKCVRRVNTLRLINVKFFFCWCCFQLLVCMLALFPSFKTYTHHVQCLVTENLPQPDAWTKYKLLNQEMFLNNICTTSHIYKNSTLCILFAIYYFRSTLFLSLCIRTE